MAHKLISNIKKCLCYKRARTLINLLTYEQMKRLFLKNILFFCTLCIIGCKEDNKNYINFVDPQNQIILTEENLPPIEYFTLEKVDISDIIGKKFFVYADSILIVINPKHPQPYMVSFYNLQTKEFIAGYIKKGIGPGEMISIYPELKDNNLHLNDYNQNSITRINIDSVLEQRMLYSPQITFIQDGYTGVSFIYNNQDTITLINTWFINGFGASNIPEFVQIDARTGKPLDKYKTNKSNYPFNICLRSVFFDKQNNKYIVPWLKFPIISIYDSLFRIEKQYIGPESVDIDLTSDEWNNIKEANVNTFYYQAPTQMGGKILLVNCRCKKKKYDDYKKNLSASEIWVFDTDKGIERRLKCLDSHGELCCLSYCVATNNIYVMDYDTGELYKCVLEK